MNFRFLFLYGIGSQVFSPKFISYSFIFHNFQVLLMFLHSEGNTNLESKFELLKIVHNFWTYIHSCLKNVWIWPNLSDLLKLTYVCTILKSLSCMLFIWLFNMMLWGKHNKGQLKTNQSTHYYYYYYYHYYY